MKDRMKLERLKRTQWIEQRRYPSQNSLFSIPHAIYFLLKFNPSLSKIKIGSIESRIELYFWWDSVGRYIYKDISWPLVGNEVEYLNAITDQEYFCNHKPWIHNFLKGRPELLARESFREYLKFASCSFLPKGIGVPNFIRLIIDERVDLKNFFNFSSISGLLECMEWWDQHGKNEYLAIDWEFEKIFNHLRSLDELYGLPNFIHLIFKSRPDLKSTFNLRIPQGRINCILWWVKDGVYEYPYLAKYINFGADGFVV